MIRENLQSLQIDDGFKILELDLTKALDVCARDGLTFDVAFIDPPYDRSDIYDDTLRKFDARPLLSSNGVLIFEHSKRSELPETSGSLRKVRTLMQGDSSLVFYRSAERKPDRAQQ